MGVVNKAKALSSVALGSAVLMMAGPVFAADAATGQDNYFARDRNVSVRERARPGYDALGVRLSSFIVYPKLEAGGQYDSNIYGVQNNVVGDFVGVIKPEIDIDSTWARNSFKAFARANSRFYASRTNEDTTDYQVGGSGSVDLADTVFSANGDWGYLAEPRTSSVGQVGAGFTTVHPIEYYLSEINGDATHVFNRLKLEGAVGYQSYGFQNATNLTNQQILESPFDVNQMTASGKVGYAVSPDTSLYGSIGYNTISYPNNVLSITGPYSRDSNGETYNVGADFDITQLIRGNAEFGYFHQDFSAANFKSVDGFHASGKVEWFPTQLTTVTLAGGHDVNPATVQSSPSLIISRASGQVDHELLRNLILTGSVRWENDDYQGITRRDNIEELTASADYLLSRNIGVHFAYDYLTQDSVGADRGPNFNDNRVTISTTLQY